MEKLTTKEKLLSLSVLLLISVSITFVDWLQRGQAGTAEALWAGVIAVICLFWLPAVLAYYLIGKFASNLVYKEFPLWLLCFYAGYLLWGMALGQLYSSVQLGWLDLFFISLPWATGTYIVYRAYGSYQALQRERLLRQQAELKQLKQALHPHFLFNSLNTLSAFIAVDPAKAEQLTQDLAAVLRHLLDAQENATISLQHELLVLQKWLNIEQARFGSDLQLTVHIEEDALSAQLPPFLVQPLVENCIQHRSCLPVLIELSCRSEGRCLQIEIRDNGPGFPTEVLKQQAASVPASGVGLSATMQRIALTHGAQCQLSNGPAPYGAVVSIELQHG